MTAFPQEVPDPGLVNAKGQRVDRRDLSSPADQNLVPENPPPTAPEPEHIIMTKGGQTRKILKAEATHDVMAAFFWEDFHPRDYRTH